MNYRKTSKLLTLKMQQILACLICPLFNSLNCWVPW